MAEKNEADLMLSMGVYTDEKSVIQATNTITKKILDKFKDGHIDIPIDLSTQFDKNNKNVTKQLLEAQDEFIKEYNRLSDKGFSASTSELKNFVKLYDEYKRQISNTKQTGSKQNLAFRDSNLNEIFQDYHKEMNKLGEDVANSIVKGGLKLSKQTKKLVAMPKMSRVKSQKVDDDQLAAEFDNYVKSLKEKYEKWGNQLGSTDPKGYKKNTGADPGRTNEHVMKLSEYSAHGSNWANELASILKEEVAKAAKTLVTYIDPNYAKRTQGGRKTTEQEFLTDTIENVRKQLRESIIQLEAGSEDITLDTLKEQAAVIKVLNKTLGKTTEDAEKAISSAIQSRYTPSEKKKLNLTKIEGAEQGVGPGHENAQKLIGQLYKAMHAWDSEVVADKIAKEMALGTEKTVKVTSGKKAKNVQVGAADRKSTEIKSSDEYKAELAKLTKATDQTHAEIRKTTKAAQETTKATTIQTSYDKLANSEERVSDSDQKEVAIEHKDISREDMGSGTNSDVGKDEIVNATKDIGKAIEANTSGRKGNGRGNGAGKGGQGSNDLGDTGPSILKEIRDILTHINKDTTSIFALLPKLIPASEQGKQTDKKLIIPEWLKPKKATAPYEYSMEMSKAWESYNDSIGTIKEALKPVEETLKNVHTAKDIRKQPYKDKEVKRYHAKSRESKIDLSKDISTEKGIGNVLKKIFGSMGSSAEIDRIKNMNQVQRERELAVRRRRFGIADSDRDATATGDKARAFRMKSLYNRRQKGANPFKDLTLTPGINVNTKGITEAMETMIKKNMFSAQTGVNSPLDLVKLSFGGIGMPSLEKSRAQADAANEILSIIRQAVSNLTQSIEDKETNLRGMEAKGQARFSKNGKMLAGTGEAWTMFGQLEESKMALNGIISEMRNDGPTIRSNWW